MAESQEQPDRLPVLEDWQWRRLAAYLAKIIDDTGWGEVRVSIKNGRMDEISLTMTEKPRRPEPPRAA